MKQLLNSLFQTYKTSCDESLLILTEKDVENLKEELIIRLQEFCDKESFPTWAEPGDEREVFKHFIEKFFNKEI